MFTAKKWSWKRVVANLLLVPVLTGGTVAIVHAQFNKDKTAKPTASKPAPARPANGDAANGESSRLLKEGRKASWPKPATPMHATSQWLPKPTTPPVSGGCLTIRPLRFARTFSMRKPKRINRRLISS